MVLPLLRAMSDALSAVRKHDGGCSLTTSQVESPSNVGSSYKGLAVDDLVLRGEEGRGKLR